LSRGSASEVSGQSHPCIITLTKHIDEELKLIDEHFRDDKFKIPAFGIYGEGGVGKTQIALRHIYSQRNRTYKAIFWFHADTDDKLANDCDEITIQLGLQEKRSSLEEGRRLFNLWLQDTSDWLLVFDNVEDIGIVAPYWPTSIGSKGYIIVTSRNPQIARAPLTTSKEVESFSIADGTKMLLSELSSYTEDEERVASEITTKLGGLPLAIHHMACFARDRSISLSEALKLYEEEESMVVEAGVDFGQDRTLATVWSLSISTLSNEALQLLDTISLFDPDSIPTRLIEHFETPNAVAISSALGNFGLHSKAMSNLYSRSLVRKKGLRTSQILSIHRLIQSAVRRRWSDDQKMSAFEKAAFCIEQVYPRQVKGQSMAEMYSECATYNSHMLSIYKYFCKNKDQLTPNMDYAEILAHCSWYYYERAQLTTSMEILRTAEEICLRLLDSKMNATLGLVYNNMACIFSARRQRQENMEYISLAIRHREASISRDDPEIQQLGISYMNYANVLQSRSVMRLTAAETYYMKALEIRENCPGSTPEGLELTLNAIGSFKFIAGDVKGAQPYIERAIALHPQLKVDTTFTLHTLYVWGDIQWTIGKRDEGYETQLRCLEGMKKLEGEYHWMTGVSYHKVGCLAHMMGKESEAIGNLQAALKTFRAADCAPGFVPRTCLVLGKVLIEKGQRLDDTSTIIEGETLKLEGSNLAFAITGRRGNMETTRDFDELVARSYR
jgi:tetratricopeptide (TPR) repeat protein